MQPNEGRVDALIKGATDPYSNASASNVGCFGPCYVCHALPPSSFSRRKSKKTLTLGERTLDFG